MTNEHEDLDRIRLGTPQRRLLMSAHYLGNNASVRSGRTRALRLYPSIGACVSCGNERAERHHVDGNTLNNDASNIAVLCRKCHMSVDGRRSALRVSAKSRLDGMIRAAAEEKRSRTNCIRGHSLSGDNLYINKSSGKRVCVLCRTMHKLNYRMRNANR